MIPGDTRFNECYSGPLQRQMLGVPLGQQGAKREPLRAYAVVHRCQVVVLEFASFSEGGKSRLFRLDVLVPVHRVQRADERTRTAYPCSLRVSLFPTPNSAKNGCFAGACDSDLSVKYQQISP